MADPKTGAKKRRSERELLDALHDLEVLEETCAMTDDEIAADIAKHGGDPVAIAARGAAFARALRERTMPLMAGGLPREALLAQVEQAAKRDPRVATALRGRAPAELSDEELRGLLAGR
jgi:hypothetical protein